MEAWLGLIGAILGATLGWGLSESSKRRQALRDLESAALVCLDRLLKINSANDRDDEEQEEQTEKELWRLGGDLDRYRDAIAATRQHRREHWQLYRETMPLLLEHDLTILDQLISRYEQECGSAALELSSNTPLQPTPTGRGG